MGLLIQPRWWVREQRRMRDCDVDRRKDDSTSRRVKLRERWCSSSCCWELSEAGFVRSALVSAVLVARIGDQRRNRNKTPNNEVGRRDVKMERVERLWEGGG